MKNSADHVVMGDKRDLLCLNCGGREKIPLPLPINQFNDLRLGFTKRHRKCEKTWEWPIANPNTDMSSSAINENTRWWIHNGEHGTSAKTILKTLGHTDLLNGDRESHPADSGDFRRCHLLLNAIPQFRFAMGQMRKVSPVWDLLVDNWKQLTELLEAGRIQDMETLMRNIGCRT